MELVGQPTICLSTLIMPTDAHALAQEAAWSAPASVRYIAQSSDIPSSNNRFVEEVPSLMSLRRVHVTCVTMAQVCVLSRSLT
jgi:hypothetical protein